MKNQIDTPQVIRIAVSQFTGKLFETFIDFYGVNFEDLFDDDYEKSTRYFESQSIESLKTYLQNNPEYRLGNLFMPLSLPTTFEYDIEESVCELADTIGKEMKLIDIVDIETLGTDLSNYERERIGIANTMFMKYNYVSNWDGLDYDVLITEFFKWYLNHISFSQNDFVI